MDLIAVVAIVHTDLDSIKVLTLVHDDGISHVILDLQHQVEHLQLYSWECLQAYNFDLGPQNFKWRSIAT